MTSENGTRRGEPVVVYVPPEGTPYVLQEGKVIFGVSVWTPATAALAYQRFRKALIDTFADDSVAMNEAAQRRFLQNMLDAGDWMAQFQRDFCFPAKNNK